MLSKGVYPHQDSYSAFQARDDKGRDFDTLLRRFGVDELYIGGLATDYCVKFSALDAAKRGLKVKLLKDAVRGVNLRATDSARALAAMKRKGIKEAYVSRLR